MINVTTTKEWIMMKRMNLVLAGTVLISGLALGGYALSSDAVLANEKEENQSGITYKEAEEIAIRETGGGHILQLERDRDDGEDRYEVEIHKDGQEYEFDIAADSGEVKQRKSERIDDEDNDDDDEGSKLPADALSTDEAIKRALEEVDGIVSEVELDKEDGQYVYEIEVETGKNNETTIDIAAVSGEVLKVDMDD
ncbi:hypothetical protein CHH59_13330 [Shouchella clausii]|uniref:PepSY domain-containing protein n=3 Tax=Shouchella clausii TaxID=79880 RepID=A0A268S218_SHOCL|nr:hypothetical protein CHH71_01380 [Shouchella clausii]PAF13615.1 hypothetical protein CHH59_13330 [Shouchella clausii]PAF26487.1 hypothetical protein CHH61_07665 [Shouchella clausii]